MVLLRRPGDRVLLAVNAVVFEQIGSVSRFVFSVPGLRAIPARAPGLARYFDLDLNGSIDDSSNPDPR